MQVYNINNLTCQIKYLHFNLRIGMKQITTNNSNEIVKKFIECVLCVIT